MTSKEVINFIRDRLAKSSVNVEENQELQPMDPQDICEELISRCLAPDACMGTGCDNMTVVLVCFLHGKPYSHMLVQCSRPAVICENAQDLME